MSELKCINADIRLPFCVSFVLTIQFTKIFNSNINETDSRPLWNEMNFRRNKILFWRSIIFLITHEISRWSFRFEGFETLVDIEFPFRRNQLCAFQFDPFINYNHSLPPLSIRRDKIKLSRKNLEFEKKTHFSSCD